MSALLNSSVPSLQNVCPQPVTDASALAPRIELPAFDGANPKLWKWHCDEYFHHWGTPDNLKVSYASSLFSGPAATSLESYLQQEPEAAWLEFAAVVLLASIGISI
jgi:hypothetical protein